MESDVLFELMSQHDHYQLPMHISISRRENKPWYVYFNGIEVHAFLDSKAHAIPFEQLCDALEYARNVSVMVTQVALGRKESDDGK